MKLVVESMARLQARLAGLLLAVSLGLVTVQLFSGYLGMEAVWAGRASLWAMIWGVFLESGVLVYEKSHFSVQILSGRIRSERLRAAWDAVISLVKLVFSILLIYYGFRLCGTLAPGARAELLHRGFLWLSLPVCGLTSAVYLLYHIGCDIRRFRGSSPEKSDFEMGGGTAS